MKRINEKVKDLVEVRSYRSLSDFLSDAAQTLSSYHFTDFTADLMSQWLDKIAETQMQKGAARALAGYRGVGKSHFLATLGAIISHPELRSRISDSTVSAAAQRLKRRKHPVAYVRRGTNANLFEELKDGLALAMEIERSALSDSLEELLNAASVKAGDLPFVIIVDTALERSSRVSRDDGIILGEIAELSKKLNIFVAVALDDDITGADGVNAPIAGSFAIDYLDQEHLYRVVDSNIFPKHRHSSPVIHDLYVYFRGLLPSFRWSEQRFAALYPLHPLILEIAPFVRLYAPEFALLSFASEAGTKVLGRPANSLVGPDEVFDRAEPGLRKAEDLADSFKAYDEINSQVISQIPVMQRLQAKLVLKALILLSLDGNGTTASEISAAMLIYDEHNPQNSIKSVEEILEKFVAFLPNAINRIAEENREVRYSFKVRGKDNLNESLALAAKQISPEIVPQIMRRFATEKLADWTAANDATFPDIVETVLTWRGSRRIGRIIWAWNEPNGLQNLAPPHEDCDWEIFVNNPAKNPISAQNSPIPVITWQPAPLTAAEIEAILRYHVLLTDKKINENFQDQVRAAGHAHFSSLTKIWSRIFLEQGKFLHNGRELSFSEHSKSAHNLPELLSDPLTEIFDANYPQHPIFADVLSKTEVTALVSDFFGGARQNSPETRQLAANFAAPLGLVSLRGDNLLLESEQNISRIPYLAEVISKIENCGGETILLKDIYRLMKKPPFGLERESVQILLTALVALRRVEFVTSKGDRINRRSLDLKIIWDDLIGIAPPTTVTLSDAQLAKWAKLLTSNEDIHSVEAPQEQEKIRQALQNWLEDWKTSAVLPQFENLSEDTVNTKIWRIAANVGKVFKSVSSTAKEIVDKNISVEEGLARIADSFAHSEKEFLDRTKDLAQLKVFLESADLRENVRKYLALCEMTDDSFIEELRQNLLYIIEEISVAPSEILNRELERLWSDFKEKYAEFYTPIHNAAMNSHHLREKFDEILRSEEWWEFENLSALPIFHNSFWKRSQEILRTYNHSECRVEVGNFLNSQPFCICSFRPSQAAERQNLPFELKALAEKARQSYRKTLMILRETLIPMFKQTAQTANEVEYAQAAAHLSDIFAQTSEIPVLSNTQLVILRKLFQTMSSSPMLSVSAIGAKGFQNREELRLQYSEWLDELPGEPVLIKI